MTFGPVRFYNSEKSPPNLERVNIFPRSTEMSQHHVTMPYMLYIVEHVYTDIMRLYCKHVFPQFRSNFTYFQL